MIRFIPILILALLPVLAGAAEWRDMLREQIALQAAKPDLAKEFPAISEDMARLGEAFAKTCYAGNERLGRKNFLAMVHNLGMENPTPAELRQFLNPNKKPWDGYTGPKNGNFHMLCNSGTLCLDKDEDCSKDHPAFALAKKYSVGAGRVKSIMQGLAKFIRNEKLDTSLPPADFGDRFRKSLSDSGSLYLSAGEISFAKEILKFSA